VAVDLAHLFSYVREQMRKIYVLPEHPLDYKPRPDHDHKFMIGALIKGV